MTNANIKDFKRYLLTKIRDEAHVFETAYIELDVEAISETFMLDFKDFDQAIMELEGETIEIPFSFRGGNDPNVELKSVHIALAKHDVMGPDDFIGICDLIVRTNIYDD